jgi:hypothetical protein
MGAMTVQSAKGNFDGEQRIQLCLLGMVRYSFATPFVKLAEWSAAVSNYMVGSHRCWRSLPRLERGGGSVGYAL